MLRVRLARGSAAIAPGSRRSERIGGELKIEDDIPKSSINAEPYQYHIIHGSAVLITKSHNLFYQPSQVSPYSPSPRQSLGVSSP